MMICVTDWVENIAGKGENAGYHDMTLAVKVALNPNTTNRPTLVKGYLILKFRNWRTKGKTLLLCIYDICGIYSRENNETFFFL